jgi:hypothetical protein
MPRRVIDVRGGEVPLLDFGSYGRDGPRRGRPLSPAEVALIARTVARTPEAMIKVLPAGRSTVAAVGQHIDYVGRQGDVALETDDGQELKGDEVGRQLLEDWDLDLEEQPPAFAPVLAGGQGGGWKLAALEPGEVNNSFCRLSIPAPGVP